jgi:tight adherence protein C
MQGLVSLSHVLVGLVFVSVFLLTFPIMRALLVRSEVRRRAQMRSIADLGGARSARNGEAIASEFLAFVGKLLPPPSAEGYSRVQKEMIKAGFFSPHAVVLYHAARIILPLGLPFVLLAVLSLIPSGLSAETSLLGTVCMSGLGFIGPGFYINHRQKSMRRQYRTAFPDFMDLLVVCVEAGLALQAALDRISRELIAASPQFSANLHLVGLELRAGSALAAALESLAKRLDFEEAYSLASLLKQSEELGTSLSAALRVYSEEMRDKRFMRAEALAQALPVKIVLPVGFCIFPVILVVLFLPLFIRISKLLVF